MKNLVKCLVALFCLVAGTGCANSTNGDVIRLGVVGENNDVWEFVRDELKEEGIYIDFVTFTDFIQPNIALAAGDIELNAFQTVIFLDNFNKEQQTDLVPIGNTVINPLGIYSLTINEISDVQQGDRVAIPNDVTNGGRALLLLQSAGLITVDPAAGHIPTVNDILKNPLALEILELDATQTARSLEDVTIAAINSGLAIDAGFLPLQDAIFLEPLDESSAPYINVIASRRGDASNEIFNRIVEVYQREETKEVIARVLKGASLPAWD